MIKISLRRNSIYIIQLIIYYNIRRVIKVIIGNFFSFYNSLIFTLLMLFGEFFGGLTVYLYQITFLRKVKNQKQKLTEETSVIKKEKKMKRIDGNFKIILLLFFSAYFDYIEYVLLSYFIPKLAKMSPTADLRLNSMSTISSCILFIYALKLKIGKHQFFSLVMIGICLLLTNIIEFIYQIKDNLVQNIFLSYLLTYFSIILMAFTDLIEKYLTYFNFLEPMLILVAESIFGIIMVLFNSDIWENPFKEIKDLYNNLETDEFILFIFLLFLYFALCAGINVYRIFCVVFYSPMYKSISSYILNPVMIIFSFFFENDFLYEGKQNILYLVLNIVIAIIILFFGCVYNEFIILYFWKLEYETHNEISKRANEIELIDLSEIYNDNDDNEDYENDVENNVENNDKKDNNNNNHFNTIEEKGYIFYVDS